MAKSESRTKNNNKTIFRTIVFTLIFLDCQLLISGVVIDTSSDANSLLKTRKDNYFPKGFLWGLSSTAYQTEGAWNSDGK